MGLRDVLIKIGGDSSKYERSMRSVKLSTGQMASHVEKSWTSAARKIGAALGMITAGYGVKQLAGELLDVAGSFEQMELKLNALTKGKGRETLEELNAWALDMPVNTRKVVDTFAMMMAMGLDPTIAKMETLTDVSVIFGEDALPRVARALGQMKTLGKLSAEELNQLSEAGINARKYLIDAFGMGVEELKKSQVSIDSIIGAIMEGLEKDFGGAAKDAMNNWQGLKATTVSYVEEIERRLMAAGLFDEIKAQLRGVNDELKDWIDNNEDLIRQKVPEYITKTKDAIKGIKDIYDSLPAGAVSATGYGIVGGVLFGGKAGVIVGAMALLNTQLETFGLNIGSLKKDYEDLGGAMGNIWDVITGKKDWMTGQELGPEGRPIFRGKMPPRPGTTWETETLPPLFGGGGAGGGTGAEAGEFAEEAKKIAEGVVGAWHEVIAESEGFGLAYEFYREQALLEEGRQAELERLRAFGEQKISLNQWEHDAAIALSLQRQDEEIRIAEYTAKAKIQAELNYMQTAMNIGRAIQAFVGTENKVVFGMMKAVEVAKATMAAFTASNMALASPPGPPWTIPLAQSVLMMGLANAAAIGAVAIGQIAGIGGASPGAGSTGAVTAAPVSYASPDVEPVRAEGRPTMNIYIREFVGEESYIDYLIERINQAGQDRDVYVYATHAGSAEELGY